MPAYSPGYPDRSAAPGSRADEHVEPAPLMIPLAQYVDREPPQTRAQRRAAAPPTTPEQDAAWEHRKLDQRCPFGHTQAASTWCPGCKVESMIDLPGPHRDLRYRDIEYRTHAEQMAMGQTSAWCGNSLRSGPMTGLEAYRAKNTDADPPTVDVSGQVR